MQEIKKPDPRQESGARSQIKRGKDINPLLIIDAGMQTYFDQLVKIADTRQNPYVKNRIIQLTEIIRQATAEKLQHIDNLYRENETLKRQRDEDRKFIVFCAEIKGFDPNLWWKFFESEQLNKKFLDHAKSN